jgi:AcrR family transcriptional regulator
MTRTRLLLKDRQKELLDAALRLAAVRGYAQVTRKDIADACCVSEALVSHHFGTMTKLRRTLVRHSVKQAPTNSDALRVLGQAIVDHNAYALKADEALRRRAVLSLVA